jgi:hypothetical protein
VKGFRNFRNVAVGVNYQHLDEAAAPNNRCNHILADFVTSNARILLYIVIDILKDDLVYCDTGMFIYLFILAREKINFFCLVSLQIQLFTLCETA